MMRPRLHRRASEPETLATSVGRLHRRVQLFAKELELELKEEEEDQTNIDESSTKP